MVSGIALVIIIAYSSIFQDNLFLNILLMGILACAMVYLFLEKQKFSFVVLDLSSIIIFFSSIPLDSK